MNITLNRKTFKALASETRVDILKALEERRKTLTELSKELDMKPSSMKEQVDKLRKSDLIKLNDEGRKWKYYEITKTGKKILNPYETKVMIVLSTTLIAALTSTYFSVKNLFSINKLAGAAESAAAMDVSRKASQQASQSLPFLEITLAIVFFLIAGMSLWYLLKKKSVLNI